MINPIKYLISHSVSSPDKPAIVSTKLSISFKECLEKVKNLALKFRKLGIKPDQIVVIIFEDRTLEWLITLALIHEGAVTVSHIYYKLPDELKADFILCDREFDKSLFKEKYQVLDQTWFLTNENVKDITPLDYQSEDSLFRITLSSGTTGEPKCVPSTIKNFEIRFNLFRSSVLKFCALDISKEIILFSPMNMLCLAKLYLGFLINGQTYYDASSSEEIVKLIKIFKINTLTGSPKQLLDLINHIKEKKINITGLENVQCAGSKISLTLLNEIKNNLCKKVISWYGCSETGMISINFVKTEKFDENFVGYPSADNKIQIVNDQEMILANQQEGLIRIKTPYMATGYYNNKKVSKNFFKDGWFYSGDIGYLTKQGELFLTGRSDERINLNGVKIDPRKIDILMESYPEIKEAACFPLTKSDGQIILGAAFVSNQEEFNLKNFVDYLLTRSHNNPSPKMFIKVNKIPRNNNDKITRYELSRIYSVSENNELVIEK